MNSRWATSTAYTSADNATNARLIASASTVSPCKGGNARAQGCLPADFKLNASLGGGDHGRDSMRSTDRCQRCSLLSRLRAELRDGSATFQPEFTPLAASNWK